MNQDQSQQQYGTLIWEGNSPRSQQFDDIYFSCASGVEESRYVFLQHNQLEQRWRALPERAQFVIGETGFGTGLNFLVAAELWLRTAPASARLHYVSVEKYPLKKADLIKALALWPTLASLAQTLIAVYPDHLETEIYPLTLAQGRVQLTLTIDDASAGLGQQLHRQHPQFITPTTRVDAWFLDGFAPSKNPDMWTDTLFATLAGLSHAGTTLATFTCAGHVRRGLGRAGFEVRKVKGFGHKRDMISAQFVQTHEAVLAPLASRPRTPWQAYKASPTGNKTALIIGAGISGCHSARALAESGWKVTVVDRHAAPAQGASGNLQGVVYAKLSPKRHPQGRFNIATLGFAQEFYKAFWRQQPHHGQACGVLQLAAEETTVRQQHASLATLAPSLAVPVDRQQASALAELPLPHGGLFLPNAGWLNPLMLCTWLLDHPAIEVRWHEHATSLTPLSGNRWRIHLVDSSSQVNESTESVLEGDLVVVCCADKANQFSQLRHLPLQRIRGQVTHLPATPASRKLKRVVTLEGYLAPTYQDQHCLGATFNLGEDDPELNAEDQLANLQLLNQLAASDVFAPASPLELSGRVGFRCTSPDYLPLVGPVPDEQAMAAAYAPLAKNAKRVIDSGYHYWPNLFVNLAHGSRGLAYTPLCARYIAALANSSPLPIRQDLTQALSPARFLIREITRGERN